MSTRIMLVLLIILYVGRLSAILFPIYLYAKTDPAGGFTAYTDGVRTFLTEIQKMLAINELLATSLWLFSLLLYSTYILGGVMSILRRRSGRTIILYSIAAEVISQCVVTGFGRNTILGFTKNMLLCGILFFIFTRPSTIQFYDTVSPE